MNEHDILQPPIQTQQTLEVLTLWRATYPTLDLHLATGVDLVRALRHTAQNIQDVEQIKTAVEMLELANSLRPDDSWLLSDLAMALLKAGNTAEASRHLRRSLEIDSGVPERWFIYAHLCMQNSQTSEAEEALQRSVTLNDQFSAGWASLGMTRLGLSRFAAAALALRRAVELGSEEPLIHACLGEALLQSGQFIDAASAYRRQTEIGAVEGGVLRKYAYSQFIEKLLRDNLEDATALYAAIAGDSGEPISLVIEKAMHLLSAHNYDKVAAECSDYLVSISNDVAIPKYIGEAIRGQINDRAPDLYLRTFFDKFAETFEDKLVRVLDYRIPEKIVDVLSSKGCVTRNILDLGCGTGLVGKLLKSPERTIVGVDISEGMLAKAAEANVYSALICSELHQYLSESFETFDTIIAADVLVYIGDLQPLFTAAASCLSKDGRFIISVEIQDGPGFRILSSGRFCHSISYLESVAGPYFELMELVHTDIRLDAAGPVPGAIFCFKLKA